MPTARPVSRGKPGVAALAGERLKRLRAVMRRASISHLLVTGPVDVGYLTGFLGGDSVLLVGPGRPTIISDSRYDEDLTPQRAFARVVTRDGSMAGAIATVLEPLAAEKKIEALGVQREHMTLAADAALRQALKKRRVPGRLLTPTEGLVGGLRRVKSPEEIGLIRAAIAVQEAALVDALGRLRAGMSESAFAAEIELEMKRRGSSAPGFETIVGAGPNASRPHYRPAGEVIRRGSPVLIDWGATVAGYHGDMTRVVCLGRWPRQMREIYEVVLEAHEAAVAALKPGASCVEVDAAARGVIGRAGFGDRFGHGLGHGLGMNVHESPSLSRHAGSDVLEPGNVVTIEPGVYLPGVGGVRIEDDYAVTARGCRNLCSLPKDIGWATL